MTTWKPTSDPPPPGQVVDTKRLSKRTQVYRMPLVYGAVTSHRNGWFTPDGELQVMDEPTHWRPLKP